MSAAAEAALKPAGPCAPPGRSAKQLALLALKPFFLAAGALAYALLRLLEPWRRVRVGMLMYDRVGHLAMNTEVFLRARAAEPRPEELTILVSGPPANRQLFEMIRRRTRVWASPWALRLYAHGLKPLVQGTRFELPLPFKGNEYSILAGAGPQLSFTESELARGRELSRELGIEGRPFVCFHARDKAYLDARHGERSREQWSYHDYRDCDVANYLPAVRKLADRGLVCLRMGAVADKPLGESHPGIIDYAMKHRTDFGDIYLSARCKFMLASTSGVCVLPPIFDRPVALANFTPLGYAAWSARDLFIPKTYHDREGGPIPYRKLMELGASMWLDGAKFEAAGIRLEENAPEDILDLAEEMDARLDGRWVGEPEDEELQARYRALFPPDHRITGYPARVGAGFLRRHKQLLD